MPLVPQTEMITMPSQNWQGRMFAQLSERLTSPSPFPCLFSQNAFKRELLLFSFVEDFSLQQMQAATRDVSEYVEISKKWDGSLATAHPLLMAFSHDAIQSIKLEDYHAAGWKMLQYWHEADAQPWPEKVAKDPHSPFWSMCFNGMQLFTNMSCPAHSVRKSRNLGDYLILVINPRERFDIVAGDTPEGRKVRTNIRRRIEIYDGVPHCNQLGSYEAGEIEWWQYGIVEDNKERTDRCPFHFVDQALVK
ncbi:YqcI/YcgG family protein [Agrobacterium rosae]|uniref:YqcI/YcgG family protein n=1 Tax=Agrobacterium rosae TaxID=1972867 RepID=UPI0019D3FFEF|nr:YqcI/YcgG family protein [Agrobacterium rosae]MBN7809016.1 YqcI/YcgG family protein [Agrobacterium rosae]